MKTIIKRCSKCKEVYFWNPDVGEVFCPYCGPKVCLDKFNKKNKKEKSNSEKI